MTIDLLLNGEPVTLACAPHASLRTVLRRAGWHSVRFGSDTGESGAAGVLVDGVLVSADVMLAAQADGHEIETVEGLAGPREIHPIQQAFIDTGAIQSGYSTPAMILAAKALLERRANPTEKEIRDALEQIPLAHRVALAMRATQREREFLLHDGKPQVLEALARNPNLRIEQVRSLAGNALLLSSTLELLAKNERWIHDDSVKIQIVTHRNVPVPLATSLVEKMNARTLRKVVQKPTLHHSLRTRLMRQLARGTR